MKHKAFWFFVFENLFIVFGMVFSLVNGVYWVSLFCLAYFLLVFADFKFDTKRRK